MRKPSRTVLGLDLGHHTVKAVLATANASRLQITRMERIPLPRDMPDPGKVLRKWHEEEELGAIPVVCSVGGSRVMYQNVLKEPDDPRTPEQVAEMESLRFSDMTDARMLHTVSPASENLRERRLLLAMARPDLLDAGIRPVVDAGFRLINVLPTPLALYNGVTALGEPVHQPTMFVDLGANHTEVSIGDGQGVLFARSFPMGTSQLTQAVMKQAQLPPGQAERARIQAHRFEELPGDCARSCGQFVSRWMRELNACMHMYQTQMGAEAKERAVRRVMLSGGGVLWEPLFEALKAASPLPLSLVGRVAGHEQEDCADFMIAAGLAADGLRIGRARSSLLPDNLRAGLTRQRNKRYWLVSGVFSVAAMGMIAVSTRVALARENEQLNRQNTMLQRGESLRQEIESLNARMELMEEMTAPLVRFVSNSARIRGLTLTIAEEKGGEDFITFIGDSESYLELRVLAEESQSSQDRSRQRESLSRRQVNLQRVERLREARMNRLIVEGFTPREDLTTVRALIEALREHEAVERADLLTDDFVFGDLERDEEWQATGNRRFVLDVGLYATVSEESEEQPEARRRR